MKLVRIFLWLLLALGAFARVVVAHEPARSRLTVTGTERAAEIMFSAHVADLSHELDEADAAMLLRDDLREKYAPALAALMIERCVVAADGAPLLPFLRQVEVDVSARVWRFHFTAPWARMPDSLEVRARPFPWDGEHEVFLTVLRAGAGRHERVLRGASRSVRVPMDSLAAVGPAGRTSPGWFPTGRAPWLAAGLTGIGMIWLRRSARGVPASLPS